jgi:hypothetical protein
MWLFSPMKKEILSRPSGPSLPCICRLENGPLNDCFGMAHQPSTTRTATCSTTPTRCHPEPQAKDLRLFLTLSLSRHNFRIGHYSPTTPVHQRSATPTRCHPEPQAKDLRLFLQDLRRHIARFKNRYFRIGHDTSGNHKIRYHSSQCLNSVDEIAVCQLDERWRFSPFYYPRSMRMQMLAYRCSRSPTLSF